MFRYSLNGGIKTVPVPYLPADTTRYIAAIHMRYRVRGGKSVITPPPYIILQFQAWKPDFQSLRGGGMDKVNPLWGKVWEAQQYYIKYFALPLAKNLYTLLPFFEIYLH